MNTRSLSHPTCKLENIEPSFFQDDSENTPKKESVPVKIEFAEAQSTLHKPTSFGSEIKLQTISKYKKKPKRPWTPEEDSVLKELVLNKGAKEWAFISSFFNDRCGKQCRERWHNHLRNGIKKGDWSSEEEWLLFLGVQAYGKRWSIISKILQGRTQNTLKNHWNCKMKPKKDGLTKKLNQILSRPNSSVRATNNRQASLIKLIKAKPQIDEVQMEDESENTKLMIKFFQTALKNFHDVKQAIYNSYEAQRQLKEMRMEERAHLEWNLSPSFGKIKKEPQEEKVVQTNVKNCIMEEEMIGVNAAYGMYNDLDSESNDLHLNINGSVKEVLQLDGVMFDENESELGENEGKMNEEESNFEVSQPIAYEFYSPLKRNIFEGMDFEESSKKRRLFE